MKCFPRCQNLSDAFASDLREYFASVPLNWFDACPRFYIGQHSAKTVQYIKTSKNDLQMELCINQTELTKQYAQNKWFSDKKKKN